MNADMQQVLNEVRTVNIYDGGAAVSLSPGQDGFAAVTESFKSLIGRARSMPAFCVSLDGETRAAMREGLWVEFGFAKTATYAGMSFEKLLMQVVSSYTGFNLIRYNSVCGYAGRCYYFDSDGDLSPFYNVVKSVLA